MTETTETRPDAPDADARPAEPRPDRGKGPKPGPMSYQLGFRSGPQS